jgi:inorganic pyrophosphatase
VIVEVPRWTNAKMEISKEEAFNPIKQGMWHSIPYSNPTHTSQTSRRASSDSSATVSPTTVGQVHTCTTQAHPSGYIWNYGAFPQTWEDPTVTHAETGAAGDNDPLDVCEIGEAVGYVGQVKQVKVLGIMALLDEGETDWKVLVVDVNDPLAPRLNDIEDVERHLPGLIRATNEWFRIYKIPDGKPEVCIVALQPIDTPRAPSSYPQNVFAFSGEAKSKKYAVEIVHECNEAWKKLVITGESPNKTDAYHLSMYVWCAARWITADLDSANSTVKNSKEYITSSDAAYASLPADSRKPPAAIDPSSEYTFVYLMA